jgi:hypothetical protein
MQLFLDYDKLLIERVNSYVGEEFLSTAVDVLRKLQHTLQTVKEKKQNMVMTDLEESQEERAKRSDD